MSNRLSLAEMVSDLRAEAGHSLVGGQGTNMEETLKYQLKRTQYELYRSYDWPALIIDEQQVVAANTRHLADFPNIDKEQINKLWCRQGTEWYPITYGIDPLHYSLYDPDNNVVGFPIMQYKYDELTEALEIWPLTSIECKVMARGQILLPPLVDDADRSLLDGTLLVLYAAAHLLARQKDEDAALVLQKAQQYLQGIQKNQGSQKRPTLSMGRDGGGRRARAGIDYIPRSPRN
jgi:hypothetical protein